MKLQTVPPSDVPDEKPSITHRFLPTRRGVRRSVIVLLIVLLSGVLWVGFKFYQNAAKITGNNNPLSLLSAFTPVDLKQTNGRTNVLLAGYSADDAGHAGAELTDSIMIVSVDKADNSAVVISIPRDLYVNIPGYGYAKINEAYVRGEASDFSEAGYAAGGMGLLQKTIAQTLGVQTNYYGLINYAAFKSAVDAVGGISITINSSDSRGIYDANTGIRFANGTATLDGQTALNLARARGSGTSYGFPNSDFDRTTYQQAMLLALKTKASSTSVIANPLKIGELADSLGNNIQTDMQLRELQTLYSITKGIPDGSVKTITLNDVDGTNLLANYRTSSGQSALVPKAGIGNYTVLRQTLASFLG